MDQKLENCRKGQTCVNKISYVFGVGVFASEENIWLIVLDVVAGLR